MLISYNRLKLVCYRSQCGRKSDMQWKNLLVHNLLMISKGALVHLYDTEYLRQTHLLAVFHLENRFDASTVFRNILIESIETLKPDPALKDQERGMADL